VTKASLSRSQILKNKEEKERERERRKEDNMSKTVRKYSVIHVCSKQVDNTNGT